MFKIFVVDKTWPGRRRVGARAAATSWARPRRAVRGRLTDVSFSLGRVVGPTGLVGWLGRLARRGGHGRLARLARQSLHRWQAERHSRPADRRDGPGCLAALGQPWPPTTPEAECDETRPGRVRAAAAGEAVGRGRRTRVLLLQG